MATMSQDEMSFRAERTNRLTGTDWTQLSDAPITATKKAEYATYRQALRDLPSSTSDFANPTWPTEPTD
tara:strand:- start:899 stop:1105 length:207 start_codon:yes stop_codon:yes gene_type:complete